MWRKFQLACADGWGPKSTSFFTPLVLCNCLTGNGLWIEEWPAILDTSVFVFLPPSKCFLVLLPLLAAQAQNLTYTTPQVFPYAEISGSPIQTSNNPITAVAGDFNGDGIKDFVLLAQLAGTSSLQFFAGSVAGQFVGANQFVCSQNDICYIKYLDN